MAPTTRSSGNLDAEVSLLGSIVLSPDLIPEVSSLVVRDHFSSPANRVIWESLLALHFRKSPIDVVILTQELTQRAQLDQVGGPEKIASIMLAVPSPANALHYAKIVHDTAVQRSAVQALEWGLSEARRTPLNGDTKAHLDGIIAGLAELTERIPASAADRAAEDRSDGLGTGTEAGGLPSVPDFPASALSGIWAEWVEAHASTTEAPTAYTVATLLFAASLAINRRANVVCGTRQFPNWYGLIVGSSGDRKSTVLDRLEALLPLLDKTALGVGGFGSSEGLLKAIAAKQPRNANVLLTLSEAGVMFRKLCRGKGRETAGAGMSLVNRLYDGCVQTVSNPVSADHTSIESPLFSIVGAATPKTAGLLFAEDAVEEGLCNRFVFFAGKTSQYLARPALPDSTRIAYLLDSISRLATQAATIGTFSLTPEAEELNSAWYLENRKNGLLDDPIHKRLQSHLLKFALVHAVLRGAIDVEAQDYLKATVVADFWKRSADWLRLYWSGSERDRAENRILRVVSTRQPISRRDLQRSVTGTRGHSASIFREALGNLLRNRSLVDGQNGISLAR